ncbi:MAG: hypothetical protein NTX64_04055 [Elusimicrobia bacterium]|nr:hypothetical protein [Elusimicrobiota bacterium]
MNAIRWAPFLILSAGFLAFSGCAVLARRVGLRYTPSKNVTSHPRQTPLQIEPFADRRPRKADFGRASSEVPGLKLPIRPSSDAAGWATAAMGSELAAAGYSTRAKSDVKVGGVLKDVSCGSGARTVCAVKIEAWVVMKDGWQLLRQDYSGEGLLPPMFGEDPYELSLEEAMREALDSFRKDVERLVP